MAVAPDRLQGVAADMGHTQELKRLRCQRLVRSLIKIAHDVPFAFAARAGAMTPQRFQLDKAFTAILPFDG